MTGDDEKPLGERLERLLRSQAEGRDTPRWIHDLLTGKTAGTVVEEHGKARVVATRADGSRCEIEVRLTFPTPPPVGKRLWRPEGPGLPKRGLARLSYIVVDEIVQDDADVSLTPWPKVDDSGRLVFSDEPALYVRASVEELTEFLANTDKRPPRSSTAIRMGTVLAAVVRADRLSTPAGSPVPPSEWLVPPVYDISTAARNKANAAFYAAVAPTLTQKQVQEIEQEAEGA